LYRFDVIIAFLIAENGGKTSATARVYTSAEMALSFDSFSPFWCRLAAEYFVYLSPFEIFTTCLLACTTFFENYAQEKFPLEKFFINEIPETPLGQSALFEGSCVQICSAVLSEELRKGQVR
jgi:hypothetical protein